MTAVFIDGAAGTTGLEIHARLAGRTDLQLIELDEARRRDPQARREALNDADVALLCLPDEAAREAAALAGPRTRLLDASSAHRTAPNWTYGFPELEPGRAAEIAEAQRVSTRAATRPASSRWSARWCARGCCPPTPSSR